MFTFFASLILKPVKKRLYIFKNCFELMYTRLLPCVPVYCLIVYFNKPIQPYILGYDNDNDNENTLFDHNIQIEITIYKQFK